MVFLSRATNRKGVRKMKGMLKAARCVLAAALVWACLVVQTDAQEKGPTAPGDRERRIQKLLADCRQLLTEAHYDDLRKLAEKALELDPAHSKANLFLWIAQDFTAPPPWMAELKKKLERKISFDFVETPLRDVVSFLQQITNATIILDEHAVEKLPNSDVTLKVTDMRLGPALERIVDQVGLGYVLTEQVIFVSSKDQVSDRPRPNEVADVELELRDPESDAKTRLSGYRFHQRELGKFYIFCSDAKGSIVRVSGWDDVLLLVGEGYLTEEERKNILAGQPPPWLSDIRKTLALKISFDFIETPLRDVVHFLQSITNATIILDPKAVKELANPEVTLKVTDMKLGLALDWILSMVDLGYAYADGAIYISSEQRVSKKASLKLHHVTNVSVEVRDGPGAPKTFFGQPFFYVAGGKFSISCGDPHGRHFELQGRSGPVRPDEAERAR